MRNFLRIVPLLLLLQVIWLCGNGQSITRCYTHEVMMEHERSHPGYLDAVNRTFEAAKAYEAPANRGFYEYDTLIRVPVVFHIVYSSPVQNIHDSLITSQMEVLNEDYNRRNPDTVNTRNVFLPVAGSLNVEFYLADKDPSGASTTGITRTSTTTMLFDPFTDGVKSSGSGGVDPWPTNQYLNIWVCNMFPGLLGYAFPPDDAPHWGPGTTVDSARQGVVVSYTSVGRGNPNALSPAVARGRTTVHEVGHYFGLRHIWGDGNCTQDDGFDDTPLMDASSNQDCDTMKNSCSDSPVDYPDMIENYMDYSDERCMSMFTKDQTSLIKNMMLTSVNPEKRC